MLLKIMLQVVMLVADTVAGYVTRYEDPVDLIFIVVY